MQSRFRDRHRAGRRRAETTMALSTTTHLNFDGDARAALEFYGTVFGAEPTVVTYAMAHSADQVGMISVSTPHERGEAVAQPRVLTARVISLSSVSAWVS